MFIFLVIILLWNTSFQDQSHQHENHQHEAIHRPSTFKVEEQSIEQLKERVNVVELESKTLKERVGNLNMKIDMETEEERGLNKFVGNSTVDKLSEGERVSMSTGTVLSRQRQAVVGAFKHAWKGYHQYAWGKDSLKPVSHTSHEWFGLGLTIVDSLDSLWLMGLREEFEEAKKWVAEELELDQDRDVNLFETTIRVLGGLLSAYHLSKEEVFLHKAVSVGDSVAFSFISFLMKYEYRESYKWQEGGGQLAILVCVNLNKPWQLLLREKSVGILGYMMVVGCKCTCIPD